MGSRERVVLIRWLFLRIEQIKVAPKFPIFDQLVLAQSGAYGAVLDVILANHCLRNLHVRVDEGHGAYGDGRHVHELERLHQIVLLLQRQLHHPLLVLIVYITFTGSIKGRTNIFIAAALLPPTISCLIDKVAVSWLELRVVTLILRPYLNV